MNEPFGARNKVAIVGCAVSQAVRRSADTLGVIAVKTARQAIADAGLTVDQIDGFVATPYLPSSGAHAAVDGVSIVSPEWLARRLGARPSYIVSSQGPGALSSSMSVAINAVASGAVDYVLLHRALHNPPGKYNENAMAEAGGDHQWTVPQGYFGSVPAMALVTNEYFQRYGGDREILGRVVVEARRTGSQLPWSYWLGQPLSLEAYRAEPLLSDPMCRLDCDIPVQGVGVFILTSAERAKDGPHRPVHISGYANGYGRDHRVRLHWTLDEMEATGADLAKRLWASVGFGADQIDLPQPYDAFSPFVLLWLEALGFCPRGEAGRLVLDGGIDSADPRSLAVLSGGGSLGNGRLHGVPQLLECYLQVAGRAGGRQRKVATALSTYSWPHLGGGAIVYTNDP